MEELITCPYHRMKEVLLHFTDEKIETFNHSSPLGVDHLCCGLDSGSLLQKHLEFGVPATPVYPVSGVSNLLASLGHTGKRRIVLGHILNIL